MMKIRFPELLMLFLLCASFSAIAKNSEEVYRLSYIEREPGVDEYEVQMLVSKRYIRIDEVGEDSGFIIYDDENKTIYSVSHHDQSVLVIKEHAFSEKDAPVKHQVEYLQLADAPLVSGKAIYNYRVFINQGPAEETCAELQIVEGLLPEAAKLLRNYQIVVSGQQVKMTDNKVSDMQSECFFVDQVYNTGAYYEKGLPIQEWHSNELSRILTSYKKVSVEQGKFTVPEKYRRFSVDVNSKTHLE